MVTELRLPTVGENVAKANIVRVLVAPGDQVSNDQPVIEIDTDKATLEVPTDISGTVKEVLIKEGQSVAVGSVIMTIDPSGGDAPAAKGTDKPAAKEAPKAEKKAEEKPAAKPAEEKKAPAPAAKPVASKVSGPVDESLIPAPPSVRRVARELAVDIATVKGTGPGGRITMDDVREAAQGGRTRPSAGGGSAIAAEARPLPDFARYGEVFNQPMSNIRRVIAERLTYAWQAIPHVHQHDEADVTALHDLIKERNRKGQGPKLTVTSVVMKVLVALLRKYPKFNASLDYERKEIVLKNYFNIGIAVNTDRGLLVPVVRNVEKKTVLRLAEELDDVAQRTRAGRITADEMQGGSITITNLGGIGGTSFTPIINWPEVAILGLSRAAERVVPVDGKIEVRRILPICLAYDHRVLDGAEAAAFTADLVRWLGDPIELLLEV